MQSVVAAATIQAAIRGKKTRGYVNAAKARRSEQWVPQMCFALVAMFAYFFWLLAIYGVESRYSLRQGLLSEQGLDQDTIMKIATTDAVWPWLLNFLHRQVPSTDRANTRYSRVGPVKAPQQPHLTWADLDTSGRTLSVVYIATRQHRRSGNLCSDREAPSLTATSSSRPSSSIRRVAAAPFAWILSPCGCRPCLS